MPGEYELKCGKCGYDLTGLPAMSVCPECGQRYDTSTGQGLRRAADAQDKIEWWLRRLRTIFIALVVFFFLVCSGIGLYFDAQRVVWVGLLFAFVAGLAAVWSYVYEKPD